jgi:uncharacterized membrane protein YfcA
MDALILTLPAGLAVGASLGALGAGGSILTVPILVYLLGRSAHQATTISLIVVGAAALVGALAHARAGRVRLGPGLAFGLLGAAGSVLGSKAGVGVNPNLLLLAFAALMATAAAAMLSRSRRTARSAAQRPPVHGPARSGGVAARCAGPGLTGACAVKITIAATVVGLLTGFFGVGGGFVVVPVLVLVFGYDTATAIGTSLLVIAVNSAAALATRLGDGRVGLDVPLLAAFLAAAITGTVLGRRYAARLNPRLLGAAFSGLLIVLALYISTRSIIALA